MRVSDSGYWPLLPVGGSSSMACQKCHTTTEDLARTTEITTNSVFFCESCPSLFKCVRQILPHRAESCAIAKGPDRPSERHVVTPFLRHCEKRLAYFHSFDRKWQILQPRRSKPVSSSVFLVSMPSLREVAVVSALTSGTSCPYLYNLFPLNHFANRNIPPSQASAP